MMTSEVFWNAGINSEEDLGLQDTFLMMSSSDFESPPSKEDLDPCKDGIMTAPRNIDHTTDAQSVAGGNGGAQNIQGESSAVHTGAGGAPAASGSAGAGGGGDNNPSGVNEGGGQAPVEEDESHELHGTSSSSAGSGTMPVLVPPPSIRVPPQAVPWIATPPPAENHNGDHESENHSEGSDGISDATTALASDTEGHGQIIVSTANDPGPSNRKQSAAGNTTAAASNVTSCGIEALKAAPDNLDISSTATTSTLSSFTTSSSSGREDKKSVSSADESLRLDSSKLETSTISEHTGLLQVVPQHPVFEDRVAEFQISQEDMFAGTGERYTSTPSETIEILGFSQPTVPETLDEDSNLIIPPSPDAFEAVPFLFPGTPSEDPVKHNLKRSLPQEFTSNDDSISRKKTASEGQPTGGEGSSSTIFTLPDLKNKKTSGKVLAAAKISRYVASRMDPQTSDEFIPEENELAASPQVSENVACKITFESQTSDSQEGSSDPSRRTSTTRPSKKIAIPLFKPINKETVSDSTSGDSNSDACTERPSKENLILSQLMENIANLESPASDTKQADASTKSVSAELYCLKSKDSSSLISIGGKSIVKPLVELPDLETNNPPTNEKVMLGTLKAPNPNLTADSSKEQQEPEEMQSDDELFLHYSPTQRMESQYFHIDDEVATGEVAESDLDSDSSVSNVKESKTIGQDEPEIIPESETFSSVSELTGHSKSKGVDTVQPEISAVADDGLKGKLLESISKFKTCLNIEDVQLSVAETNSNEQQPSFHMSTSQVIVSLENELPENKVTAEGSKQVSQDQADIAGPSGIQKRTKPLLFEERMSDECNPFDVTSDEFDAPVCPVGRHKRPIVWAEDSDTREPKAQQNKKMKTATKSISCQVNIISESSTSSNNSSTIESKDQAVQTIHGVESKEITQIVSEACDTTDGSGIIRRTMIVTRTVIEEQLRNGKVIKKTVVETSDEPVISEFPDDGDNETGVPLFIQPTPSKPSPESSISKSGTSSLAKSNSSSSRTSGWLGDISSSKSSSSSSLNKASPLPSRCIPSDNTMLSNRISTPMEPKSVSGMKTLRSVKRRQFYEFKKTLNLSPVKSPVAVPRSSTKHNSSSTSSEIHQVTSPSKKSKLQRKKVVESPVATAESVLPETPIKRPRKGNKREKQSTKIQLPKGESSKVSPKKIIKDDYSRRSSQDQMVVSRPSTSRDVAKPASAALQEMPGLLQPGARVMAKWQDKFYYPGRVLQQEKDDSWLIMYDDGDARSIKVGKILVVDVLPVGQSVYAESADGEFDSGIILENFNENSEIVYKVELDGGTVRNVPRSKVCLTHDQAALLEELPTNTMHGYTSICLDNIVEGKRRSRGESRERVSPSMQRSPRTPRRSKKTFNKLESHPEGGRSSSDELGPSSSNKHSAKAPKRPK